MIDSSAGTRSIQIDGRTGKELTVSGVAVRVLEGPDAGKSLSHPSTVLSIGTDAGNDLVLSDRAVSRRHAMVTLTPEGATVEDTGSKNGTWLNGARVDRGVLRGGGRLQVGASVLEIAPLVSKVVVYPEDESSFEGMVGRSEAMREIFALVRQMAKFDLPVTITGETGTGKELIARALHSAGPRRNKQHLVLDCGSLVKELLASQLFGHEKGAFTGADRATMGIFEEADGGTVFLDEVGEIDLSLQAHLLRVLETREIQRLGSRKSIPVNFRLVSATHRDLKQMSQQGQFRSDLFYRLSAITIHVPPLRERQEDIPLLVKKFTEAFAARSHIAAPAFSPPAMAALVAHAWPGNVRELKNVCEALCTLECMGALQLEQIQRTLAAGDRSFAWGAPSPAPVAPSPPGAMPGVPGADLAGPLEKVEREAILQMLIATAWNRKLAAKQLGISRTTLYEKIRRYGLTPPPGTGE